MRNSVLHIQVKTNICDLHCILGMRKDVFRCTCMRSTAVWHLLKKKPSEEPKNKVCKHNYAENACRPLLSHFGCILDCQELSHLVNSGTVCLKSTHLYIDKYECLCIIVAHWCLGFFKFMSMRACVYEWMRNISDIFVYYVHIA